MTTISNKAAKKLKGNQRAIGRLMVLFNKSSFTIERWIDAKDVRLITPQALEIVKEETDLNEDHIIHHVKATA
jgi:hypothetical protein